MAITGINDSNSLANLYQNYISKTSDELTSSDGTKVKKEEEETTSNSSSTSLVLSSSGQIYSRLQQMQTEDPEKFKETCSKIAKALTAAVKEGTAGTDSVDLAQKFTNAAKSGKISDLTSTSTSTSSNPSSSTYTSNGSYNYSINQYCLSFLSSESGASTVLSVLMNA